MVRNLVDNAARHNEPAGWIEIGTGADDAGAFLRVVNSGEVAPDEALAGLLEPFQRLAERSAERDGVGPDILPADAARIGLREGGYPQQPARSHSTCGE